VPDALLCALVPRAEASYVSRDRPRGAQLTQRQQAGALDARATSLLGEWIRLAGNVLMPALALLPGNSGMVHEVWEALRLLPYHVRFRLYYRWKTEVATAVPILTLAKAAAENDARKIMRCADALACSRVDRHYG